ncbi:metal-dependent hydrolase [Oceaniferula marina]|uniref:metal-dependent hydrolase n=1 Tax=Oceaniferula marina TaxID=2748318 RepID=UPI001D05348D|nr:metal-dependent hydrolase [Oceaniferula marina]
MNTVTHALIPAVTAGIFLNLYRGKEGGSRGSYKDLLVIGLFGAAPDLLNPHMSLEDRYSSWSHSIFAWLAVLVFLLVSKWVPRLPWQRWLTWSKLVWCSSAYGLHLACDAVSGGIAWLYPWKADIVGAYLVPPVWWIPMDVSLFLSYYFLFRVIPKTRQPSSVGDRCA